MRLGTYPGLDITAGVLPFLLRLGAIGTGGGRSRSDIFCRFGRLADEFFAGSGSAAGLGSRRGALRFRDACAGRVDEGGKAAVAAVDELDDDSAEVTAFADERVILEDMSIWLSRFFPVASISTPRHKWEPCIALCRPNVQDRCDGKGLTETM